jgi:hypothetical protein
MIVILNIFLQCSVFANQPGPQFKTEVYTTPLFIASERFNAYSDPYVASRQ